MHGQLEVNSKVKVKTGNSTTDAVVLEKGPKTVYKVSYAWQQYIFVSGITTGCIPCKTHVGLTPVVPQVYAKAEGWRTSEV